jgi:prostaglandin-H2 D-isomerase / glutathione transferase
MDAVEDIGQQIVVTFPMKDPEKKAARERLAAGPISLYLSRLHAQLQQRGGEYFADGRLTIADLRVFVWIRHLRSGALDHVATDLAERVAPSLVRHAERLSADPSISAYYAKRRSAQGR